MYELYDPCTVMFFFRNKHIMIDLGTGNNNKISWAFNNKQEVRVASSVLLLGCALPGPPNHRETLANNVNVYVIDLGKIGTRFTKPPILAVEISVHAANIPKRLSAETRCV